MSLEGDLIRSYSTINENISTILERGSKSLSVEIAFFVNIHTGEISDNQQIIDSKDWRAIRLNEKDNAITADCAQASDLDKKAAQIMNLTVRYLNAERLNLQQKSLLDKPPSLESLKHAPAKTLDAKFLEQVDRCFGSAAVKNILEAKSDIEIADLIFSLIKEKLEQTEPIDENEIKNLYQVLFAFDLKDEAQKHLKESYHPASVVYLLTEAISALESGIQMKPTDGGEFGKNERYEGLNASYFLKGLQVQNLWVYKPENGEQSGCAGISPGGGAKREHVACLLNYSGRYPVPYTVYLSINGRIGSAQIFAPDCVKLMALRMNDKLKPRDKISATSLHSLLLFDIRFSNTDRHMGNILCSKGDPIEIFAIDNGACMTNAIEDPLTLEYLSLKQMVLESFDEETRNFIREIDIERDAEIMERHKIGKGAIEWMRLSTRFLQYYIASREKLIEKYGVELSPADLGTITLKQREALWQSPQEETFQKYFEDICSCKQTIQELHATDSLSEWRVSDLKNSFLGNADELTENEIQWIDTMFAAIIAPYCQQLTNGSLILRFY